MDLFEYLKNCVGCEFISDLRYGPHKARAIQILKQMDKSKIDNKQIADASNYFGIALA